MCFWEIEVDSNSGDKFEKSYDLLSVNFIFAKVKNSSYGIEVIWSKFWFEFAVPVNWLLESLIKSKNFFSGDEKAVKTRGNSKFKIIDEFASKEKRFILYQDGSEFGNIEATCKGPILTCWPNDEKTHVPLDWLVDVFQQAKVKMPIENKINTWAASIIEDPENKKDLPVNFSCDNKVFSVVKQTKKGLVITWLASGKDVCIPFDWLLKEMIRAKIVLPAGKIENFGPRQEISQVTDSPQDQELIIELYINQEDIGLIKQTGAGLEFIMSKNKKNVDVPLDWILEVLQNEKVQLPSGRIENMGE
jgi:hypothetical protein